MRTFWIGVGIGCLLAVGPTWVRGDETPPEVKALIEKVDRLYRSQDSYARVQMTIINPNWQRTLVMDIWSQGMTKTFIRILSPAKDRGVATLREEHEMWNYFPKIDKVMKVPPSMMMGSWMGSDFTNDDLVKETSLLEDYTAVLLPAEAGQGALVRIALTPKASTATVWGKIVLTAESDTLLPRSESYFDEKGTEVRRIEFSAVKDLGGRRFPTVMAIIPINKPGNRTVIEYQDATFDTGNNEDAFTLRNLQKRL